MSSRTRAGWRTYRGSPYRATVAVHPHERAGLRRDVPSQCRCDARASLVLQRLFHGLVCPPCTLFKGVAGASGRGTRPGVGCGAGAAAAADRTSVLPGRDASAGRRVHPWTAQQRGAQERLAAGRAGRRGDPGEAIPDGMQRLLSRARWDVDGVRDDLRDHVVEHLGEPGGVLVVEETGFVKKGPSRPGSNASTLGLRGGSRTASSACSWPMPAAPGRR